MFWGTPWALVPLVLVILVLKDCQTTSSESVTLSLREQYALSPEFWPKPWIEEGVLWQELGPIPLLEPQRPAIVALGEKLFFDPLLSASGQIACASCHEPDLAFADGRRVSFGHNRAAGMRNSPSILLSGHFDSQFWDGRAATLEQQVLMPIEDPLEMAFSLSGLRDRLLDTPDYSDGFFTVWQDEVITTERVSEALAAYIRSLPWRSTPFDRFLAGNTGSMSEQAIEGLHLFRTKGRCMNCHSGPLMSDQQFHNLGLTYYGRRFEDLGRYGVTGRPEDVGAFRTPTLRGVSRTGPWMHNGLFPNLDGVLRLYNAGMPRPVPDSQTGDDPLFPVTSPLLQPLNLSATELQSLKAFLESL
ncbi:MAG: cytochrome-c peroxidase [Nitrincola lacisaponensis]|uniref:cytochrome-c peroxidase n=1 Tax=Nitrincola lacisaponensis TaxID=267850 RepID=UPI00391A535F